MAGIELTSRGRRRRVRAASAIDYIEVLVDWIAPGSRVLDLGCGDGSVLRELGKRLGVTGYGLEIDQENIARCVRAGVDVIQMDLDKGLLDFEDNAFDYVFLLNTLQAVRNPHLLLFEMLRVGREGIVTFPNFGHWRTRIQLGLGGRMPVTPALPAQWYETGNIHLCTIEDFEEMCRSFSLPIVERVVIDERNRRSSLCELLPNLLGTTVLFRIGQGSGSH